MPALTLGEDVQLAVLFEQLHLDRVADFLPGQVQPLLLVLFDLALRRPHQIVNLARGIAHLRQNRFGRNPPVHHPHPLGLPVGLLDFVEEPSQRGAVRGVPVHHFVGQRETIRGHHQRHHNLQAIRPAIAAVAALGLGVLFHGAFEIGAGQVVEQHLEVGLKQVGPLPSQPYEQILLVLQHTVQATVQPVLFRGRIIDVQ